MFGFAHGTANGTASEASRSHSWEELTSANKHSGIINPYPVTDTDTDPQPLGEIRFEHIGKEYSNGVIALKVRHHRRSVRLRQIDVAAHRRGTEQPDRGTGCGAQDQAGHRVPGRHPAAVADRAAERRADR